MNRRAGAALACSFLLAACSSGGSAPSRARALTAPAAPVAQPYLRMTGPAAGLLVWRSGDAWVVLRSADGFRTLGNSSPPAVPTDGGLAVVGDANDVTVGVAPSGRLSYSPVLTRRHGTWTPLALPGPLRDVRAAVAVQAAGVVALLARGRGTVEAQQGRDGWRVLTDAARLSPRSAITLDSVTALSARSLLVTAHGQSTGPHAYVSDDGGTSWRALAAPGTTGTVLAPCGAGATWLLPVIDARGRMAVDGSSDGGRTWRQGGALTAPRGAPVLGCAGRHGWVLARRADGGRDEVFATADLGLHWVDRGPAPAGLTDLATAGGGSGFATSMTSRQVLWRVSGDGAHFRPVTLPAWVATLGAQAGMG